MKKLSIDRLCQSFEEAVGWPYVSPGTNDERGIDCSGMFVRAYKQQGASIYHGSNSIARKSTTGLVRLTSASQLKRGAVVFKWKPEDTTKFRDGLGDFHHIGLVVSVNPLRIIHASTVGMKVKVDTKISPWSHIGWLKDVEEDEGLDIDFDELPSMEGMYDTLKRGSKGASVLALQVLLNAYGANLVPDGEFGKLTEAAVKQFQSTNKLKKDGIVGKNTWAALMA